MAIVAKAEKNYVVLINSLTAFYRDVVQLVFVLVCCDLWIDFAAHTHDRFFRNGSRHKKIFARHSEVALRIIRRHATLVSKGEPNPIPREIVPLGRNSSVNRRWSVPARERDPKFVAPDDSFARLFENERRGVSNEILSADDYWGSAHAGSTQTAQCAWPRFWR